MPKQPVHGALGSCEDHSESQLQCRNLCQFLSVRDIRMHLLRKSFESDRCHGLFGSAIDQHVSSTVVLIVVMIIAIITSSWACVVWLLSGCSGLERGNLATLRLLAASSPASPLSF